MERAPQHQQPKPSLRQRFMGALMEKMGIKEFANLTKNIDRYNNTKQRYTSRKSLRPHWVHPLRRKHFGNFRACKPL